MTTLRAWADFLKSTGYDHRPAQDELVSLIQETLNNRGYLLARAGTGTGKSLASVIPALEYMLTNSSDYSGPVMISTATKGLQGQYAGKDLPFMEKHYTHPETKEKGFKHTLLKGRRNYLCHDRMANPEPTPSGPVPVEILKKVRSLPKDHDGDIAKLRLPHEVNLALTMPSDDCPGAAYCLHHEAAQDANGGGGCYFERAKQKAGESDVVVVNHALLAQYLKIRVATEDAIHILPMPGVIVLDECHKFAGYVQNALGWKYTIANLYRWANGALAYSGGELDEFKDHAKKLYEQVEFDHKDKKNAQQIVPRETLEANPHLRAMIDIVQDALDYWTDAASMTREQEDRRKVRRTANLLVDLEVALGPDPLDNFWVELDKGGYKILNYKPAEKKVADFMSEHMWPIAPAILLSATVPPLRTLGLPEEAQEFDVDSPFDYKRNSRLYIGQSDGVAPFDRYEREMWEQNRHNEMLKLVASSDGRALLLFTSWADLNKAYDVLAPKFMKAGCLVLKQDKANEADRDRLAREFKADERSILFGTESFFEGIDIPGNSLRLVIIYKLPFPSMTDNTRGGKLDFKEELLPEMRMKLTQAAGRLIRSHEDQGLVAVLDKRLRTKGYGTMILRGLSPFDEMTRVHTLFDACEYLESLDTEEE